MRRFKRRAGEFLIDLREHCRSASGERSRQFRFLAQASENRLRRGKRERMAGKGAREKSNADGGKRIVAELPRAAVEGVHVFG